MLRFSKYEGLGNDFLVLEGDPGMLSPTQVERLCDRHFGVGGDGVLFIGLRGGRPFMDVVNADGSIPEMCGNGLRCVALYLVHAGLVSATDFVVDTGAGPHRVRVEAKARFGRVRVQMRPASLDASEVLREGRGPHIERPFTLDGDSLSMTAVSMGNPHAVIFDDVPDMSRLGPRIEKDPRFKAGANVGFARMRGPRELDLTVWERGVGFTLACGTGACAAAVAAVETGRSPRGEALTVTLPGGPLEIRVMEPGAPIVMTGPARRVFEGQVELEAP